MPGISIHVVDVARGMVAAGMRVSLSALAKDGSQSELAAGATGTNGLLTHPALDQRFAPGRFVATFHVGAYYRGEAVSLPAVPFLDVVRYEFGIDNPDAHYHLPFKCTPWGYSCFRGGA